MFFSVPYHTSLVPRPPFNPSRRKGVKRRVWEQYIPHIHTVLCIYQRRCRRSGWSGLGRTTFQQGVGLIIRLQRQCEDRMIWPGVSHASSPLPCVYAFLVIIPALLPADQDDIDTMPHLRTETHAGIHCEISHDDYLFTTSTTKNHDRANFTKMNAPFWLCKFVTYIIT